MMQKLPIYGVSIKLIKICYEKLSNAEYLKNMFNLIFSKKSSLFVAICFAFVGAVLIISSLWIPRFNDWSLVLSNIDPDLASKYGGFIGGVAGALFGLVSAILLFLNFHSQEKSASRQQFESRYFEMIRLHRENVLEMNHVTPYDEGEYYEEGRRVFLSMHRQYRDVFNICTEILGDVLTEKDIADITYILFFFGVGRDSWKMTEPYLDKYRDQANILSLRDNLANIKTEYRNDIVRFGGHQLRLGHYYRHMFQAVDMNDDLSDGEKYSYVKLLRAQLSTTEQAIFFYNSLSQPGREWQRSNYVTKYLLIKNLPPNFVEPLDPKSYYPDITFEYEEED